MSALFILNSFGGGKLKHCVINSESLPVLNPTPVDYRKKEEKDKHFNDSKFAKLLLIMMTMIIKECI